MPLAVLGTPTPHNRSNGTGSAPSVHGREPCDRCQMLERQLAQLTSVVHAHGLVPAAGEEVDIEPIRPIPNPLSLRQYQVGVLLAEGHSNLEIGEALYIGVNSVKTHVRGLFRALGVRNRTEAALWFERLDQLDVASSAEPSGSSDPRRADE